MALQLIRGNTRNFGKIITTTFAVMAFVLQPLVSLNIPSAFAATGSVDHIVFTTPVQSVNQNIASGKVNVQAQSSSSGAEQLDTSNNKLGMSSTSASGQFSNNGTSDWTAAGSAAEFTFNNGWSQHAIYYRDATPGSYIITAKLSANNGLKSWTKDQNITVNSTAAPSSVTVGTSGNYATLQEGISNVASGGIISLVSNLTSLSTVHITKPVTIEGGGYTVLAGFDNTAKNNNSNSVLNIQADGVTVNNLVVDGQGEANLHGINTWSDNATINVALNKVTVQNNTQSGLNVGQHSHVTATNITTAHNGWSGIDVDKTDAILTVNGVSRHNEALLEIYVDNTNVGKVIDASSQYDTKNNVKLAGGRVYLLKSEAPTAPAAPSDVRFKSQSTGTVFACNATTKLSDLFVYWTNPSANYGNTVKVTKAGHKGSISLSGNGKKSPYKVYGTDLSYALSQYGEGVYTVSVRANATNSGPYSNWVSCNITYDTAAPSVSNVVITPTINGNIGGTVTVTFDVNDQSGIDLTNSRVLFSDGPNTANQLNESPKYVFQPVPGTANTYKAAIDTKSFVKANFTGNYNLAFTVYDTIGNHGSTKPSDFSGLLVDNSGPTSTLMSPTDNATVRGMQRFIFTTSDDTGVSSGYVKFNGPSVMQYDLVHGSGNEWYADVDTAKLTGGTYKLDVRLTDSFGTARYGANKGTVTVDNTAPTGALSLIGGQVVNGTRYVRPGDKLTYKVSASDAGSGLDRVSHIVFSVNGNHQTSVICGNWQNGQTSGLTSVVTSQFTMKDCAGSNNLNDGTYAIGFRVYDKADNYTRLDNEKFTVDGTKPTISNFQVDNSSTPYTKQIKASAVVTDDNLKNVTFYVTKAESTYPGGALKCTGDGPVIVPTLGVENGGRYEATLDTSLLTGSNYCVSVVAEDLATNHSVPGGRLLVTIDNTAPVFTASLSSNLFSASSTDPTLKGTITDTTSVIDHTNYAVWRLNNDGSKTNVRNWTNIPAADGAYNSFTESINTQLGLKNLLEGQYTMDVRGFDAAGNETSGGDFIFTVDNTAPTVSSIVREGSELTNSNTVNFTVTFSEAVSGVDGADFTLDPTGTAHGIVGTATPDANDSNVYHVNVTNVGGNGTLGLNFNANASVEDLVENPAVATFTAGELFTIDNSGPVVTVAAGSKVLKGQTNITITVSGDNLDINKPFVYLYNNLDSSQKIGQQVVDLSSGSGVFTVDATLLDTGNYTLVVSKFKDMAGNYANGAKADMTFQGYTVPQPVTPGVTPVTGGGITPSAPASLRTSPNGQAVLGDQAAGKTSVPGITDQAVKGVNTSRKDANGNKASLLGVAWYWWIVAAAVAAFIWWFIAARRRRKKAE